MSYQKQVWKDNDPNTPLSAERLNHIESGIAELTPPTGPGGTDGSIPQASAVNDASGTHNIVNVLNQLLSSLRSAGYLLPGRPSQDFGKNDTTPEVVMTIDKRVMMSVEEWAALYAISESAPSNVDKLAFINKALPTDIGELTGVTSIDSLSVVDTSGTKLAEVYSSYIKVKSSSFASFESLLSRFTQAVSDGEVVL